MKLLKIYQVQIEVKKVLDQVKSNKYSFNFSEESINRYSRNILLPNIGGIGQKKLLSSKVLIVGAGGLGSPIIYYLAAAGIGKITIIDDDDIELSNLQRQIIHKTKNIGSSKSDSAAKEAKELNPSIEIVSIKKRLNNSNALDLINSHDIVADGSDNFKTRFLVADTCYITQTILVSAAILKYEGQISTWNPKITNSPCYRCLFPEQPKNNIIPSCSQSGVLGSLAGFMGSLQATEVIKELLSIGKSLSGYLQIFDVLNSTNRKIIIKKDPECSLCGPEKTILNINDESFYEK